MESIDPWIKYFGRDRIGSRLFDKRIIGDDVCKDILDLLGVDSSLVATDDVTNANTSIIPEFSKLITQYDETSRSTTERKLLINEILLNSRLFKPNSEISLIGDEPQEKITQKYRDTNKEFSDLFLDKSQANILNNCDG